MQLHSKQLTLLPYMFIFALSSCKKDSHAPPAPPVPKVRTIQAGKDLRTYTYDSKGRVTEIVLALYGKQDYAYTDTGIVLSSYDTLGAFTGKTIYKLGSNGLVASYTNTYSPSDQYLCTYTAAGQLATASTIRTLTGQPTRRWDYTYYYTNNNLDSVLFSYNDGHTITTGAQDYYDEYFTDVINTLGNDNYGQAFLGVTTRHPVKLARDIGHDNTGNYPQTSYNYEYDSQSRITKSQEIWGSSSFTPLTYTYY